MNKPQQYRDNSSQNVFSWKDSYGTDISGKSDLGKKWKQIYKSTKHKMKKILYVYIYIQKRFGNNLKIIIAAIH